MTDVILQIGASKLAISIALAGVAWIVARRLLRVRAARDGFFNGMHIECTGAEGSSVSSSEGEVVVRTMTCEEAETSQGKLRFRKGGKGLTPPR